ncbi:MAG: flagellar protein FliT [Desulfobacterales bacterium]|nr:flagellar protein FliT [Desulfobacterales bacterium]
MKDLQAKVDTHIQEYEAMQLRHLSVMETQDLPDLATLTRERESRFAPLQANLQALLDNAGLAGDKGMVSVLQAYEDRLQRISELDAKIETAIKKHKEELQRLMNRMKHGKKAIKGYGGLGTPSSPRVVSMNR